MTVSPIRRLLSRFSAAGLVLLGLHTAAVAAVWAVSEPGFRGSMSGNEWLPILVLDFPVAIAGSEIDYVPNPVAGLGFLVFGGLQWYLTGAFVHAAWSGPRRTEDEAAHGRSEGVSPPPAAAVPRSVREAAPAAAAPAPLPRPPVRFALGFGLLGLHAVLMAVSLSAAKSGGETGGMALLPIGLLDFPAAAAALLTQILVPSEAAVVPAFVLLGSLQWFLIGVLVQRVRDRPPRGRPNDSAAPPPTPSIASTHLDS